ncbi:hypothetical protein QCA50_007871 [Cerrena zonata]|uniref:Uncharacterized protein n=1 Tax=Cerrena zonata TaxID=2478898 RepID=A0AAW0FS61_9APHY
MQKHTIVKVLPDMLGYISALIRFCINSQPRWKSKDGDFDNAEFFVIVRDLFNSESAFGKRWAEETLEWWNLQVFFTRPAEMRRNVGNSVLGKLHAHLRLQEELADVV